MDEYFSPPVLEQHTFHVCNFGGYLSAGRILDAFARGDITYVVGRAWWTSAYRVTGTAENLGKLRAELDDLERQFFPGQFF